MSEAIRIPAGVTLSPEALDALKAANPGAAIFVFTHGIGSTGQISASVESKPGFPAAPHREAVSTTVALIEGALHIGASFIVPPVVAGLVNSILDAGVEAVDRLITGNPQVERWPLENIRTLNAEIQGLDGPKT